jgi:dihydroorotate dehydrogenase
VALATRIDGLICTNTTLDRASVAGAAHAEQAGGLSGKPLFQKATSALRDIGERLGGRIPLIGVGGIMAGADAAAKIDAGASLVQFYTGMVYRGPELIGECVEAMRAHAHA